MPKNIRGGNKHKKAKNKPKDEDVKGQLIKADEGQIYAKIKKRLGGTRVLVEYMTTHGIEEKKALIPGKFKKKIWLNPGDIVLCDEASTGVEELCSINHKYSDYDINRLKKLKLIDFDVEHGENEQTINFVDQDGKKKSINNEDYESVYMTMTSMDEADKIDTNIDDL